jgi:hypothetical protein
VAFVASMPTKSFLDDAPGPSPWYQGPRLPGLTWVRAGESRAAAGKTCLMRGDDVLLLVSMYCYVELLLPGLLLIWRQAHAPTGNTEPVMMWGYQYGNLAPLSKSIEELCQDMQEQSGATLAAASPEFECALPTRICDEPVSISIPDPLRIRPEMLILCQSSAIAPGPKSGHGNLALMLLNPVSGTLRLYPQDWFNDGRVDLGYQWVTRVGRDPKTGRIHGDGIRIDPFILDDSMRGRV